VRERIVIEIAAVAHHAAGHAHHGRMIRHGAHHDRARADFHVIPDRDVAEDVLGFPDLALNISGSIGNIGDE
jgi:hypothetical protein